MNIKQAELLSGVSKQNIRFYERQGLLSPARNPDNDYREYTHSDIETLKKIRVMRMLDMPLDEIRALLDGKIGLNRAAQAQKLRLEDRAKQLESAIHFCEELSQSGELSTVDMDNILQRMESPEQKLGLFQQWVDDYRKVSAAEHEKVFTFFPDGPVTCTREFTAALFEYANQNHLDLVITKESMYPEFTIDGIEYRAERNYMSVRGIPVASVRCTAVHPKVFEPDLPESRKRMMKIMHLSWIVVPCLILVFARMIAMVGLRELFTTWEGWLLIASIGSIIAVQVYRGYIFTYNENGKQGTKK